MLNVVLKVFEDEKILVENDQLLSVCYRTVKNCDVYYDAVVMEHDKIQDTALLDVCDWCDEPISLENRLNDSVCSPCYALLAGSGVIDEEILASIQSNSALSAGD